MVRGYGDDGVLAACLFYDGEGGGGKEVGGDGIDDGGQWVAWLLFRIDGDWRKNYVCGKRYIPVMVFKYK